MKNPLFFVLLSVIVTQQSIGQDHNLSWATRTEGTGQAWAESISSDDDGNIYSAGYFTGVENFATTGLVNSLISWEDYDAFIAKHGPAGELLWSFKFGSDHDDRIRAMETTYEGDIIAAGFFQGIVDVNPRSEPWELVSEETSNAFIAKYGSEGDVIWAKQFTSEDGHSTIYSVSSDEEGNIYCSGRYTGTVNVNPSGHEEIHTSFSDTDVLVVKFDSEGNHIWSRSFGGWYQDEAFAISTDAQGNVYTAGYFSSTMDADPSIGIHLLTTSGVLDVFVQKMNSDGEFLWVKQIKGESHDRLYDMAVDDNGDVYLTGYFKGTADFDSSEEVYSLTSEENSQDVFLAKYSSEGDIIWAKSYGGNLNDHGHSIHLNENEVVLAGQFWGTTELGPLGNDHTVAAVEAADVFLISLAINGDYNWSETIGGEGMEFYPFLTTDATESLVLALTFIDNCDVDPGIGEELMYAEGSDVAIIRLNPTVLGAPDHSSPSSISAYPSPTAGPLTLDLGMIKGQKHLTVLNSMGQVIEAVALNTTQSLYEMVLEGPSGLYFIELVSSEGERASLRVLKQ